MTLGQLHRVLWSHAGSFPCEEVCGLIFGPFDSIKTTVTSLEVTGVMPIKNIADSPRDSFEMDYAVLQEQWKLRHGEILGIYHSHLGGPALASLPDQDVVMRTGLISVIVSVGELRVYGRHQNQVIEIGHWSHRTEFQQKILDGSL